MNAKVAHTGVRPRAVGTQYVEGQPLGCLGADAGESRELLDELLERRRELVQGLRPAWAALYQPGREAQPGRHLLHAAGGQLARPIQRLRTRSSGKSSRTRSSVT